ncbi:MAG TPA: PH domain-containing protein [Candidatus Pygmaiobacter gallistercoris]|nr:PH domain-containing protein [Candidatus Pygmaiobacter gallistercoris]
MNYTVNRKGALLAAGWLTGLCGAIAFLLWLFWNWLAALVFFAAGTLLGTGLCLLHRRGYRVRVSEREFSVERGFFYRTLQRVPLRSVTGVWILSTPLGRLLGACAVMIFTAGATVLIIGLTAADSERLRSALLTGGDG